MKLNLLSVFTLIFLFISCSSSDSSEDTEDIVVELPTLATVEISNIEETSVTISSAVSNNGGATVTEKGVVWGASSNPTTSNNKENAGSGTGDFNVTLTNLESNTTYYARSYAINSKGTAYGAQKQFTTLEPEPQQKIYTGDLILTSQQEVDDFGAQNYTVVNGTLSISDSNDPSTIVDLSPLESLTSISNDLIIRGNLLLTSIEGLNQITQIGGGLSISANFQLGTLEVFTQIEILSFLSITTNPQLTSFSGLQNLSSVAGDVSIETNYKLIDLSGLNSLTQIINGDLTVRSNDLLTNLEGLNNLTSIGGALKIETNDSLIDFTGLDNLQSLGTSSMAFTWGDLEIDGNLKLGGLDGLESLTTALDGSIEITNNPVLLNLDGLANLENMGSPTVSNTIYIGIQYNDMLSNFCGLKLVFETYGNLITDEIIGNATESFNPSTGFDDCP
ncbi:fibronectin type III domain-containing protein [Allomuricauda sp. NBRC 101325]|uniref:fibronectin type III domain-containing protein n=1 Tax=Allomuricauda sp. NBRC 101325 TaxID=1113758 RepID=UPI0024A294A5|nr:fibronectin type III domain-containing protein [Muricauda sp. NBRC 101325]GLU45085.1 hypothetical protein Musp01_27090 [Muricauda sp. NBRC 101325]